MHKIAILLALLFLPSAADEYYYISEAKKIESIHIVSEIPIPETDIISLINKKAALYGASSTIIYKVIEGESGFQTCAVGDNHQSFGLAQINLPSHPEITKEMACDPEFAIDFLARNLSEGKGYLWTVYRNL